MIAITATDKILTTNKAGWTPNDWGYCEKISVEDGRGVLDFEIQKKRNFAYDPVLGLREIPKQFHLERSTDSSIIPSTSVGEQFNPVQHRDVYDYITHEIMPKIDGMKLEMVGTFHGGGTGIIAATLGDEFAIKGDNSPQTIRVLYANPCNGTGRLTIGFTHVRIVCHNTLMAALKEANGDGWKIKHTKNAEIRCDEALRVVRSSVQAAIEMKHRAEALASIGVSGSMVREALDAVYPLYGLEEGCPTWKHLMDKRHEVIRQFESGETAQTMSGKSAWTLFNSFTYPIFNPAKLSKRTDKAQIAFSGMVGSIAKKVRDIFGKVENIALRVA